MSGSRVRAALAVAVLAVALTACAPGSVAVSGRGAAPTAGSPIAVFLGDSYTVGQGARVGYVPRTAAALGWTAVNLGESGTGYVAPGLVAGQAPYGDRVADVLRKDPGVVLVQGSTNDVGRPLDEVRQAAHDVFARLAARVERARIVVLGPLAPPGVDGAGVRAVRDVLADEAAAAGLTFLDPIAGGWLQPPDGLFADPIHPNDAGYRALADDLVAALRATGL